MASHFGYVYVITNKAMPGLVKVGMTSRTPEKRAAEIGRTGSPHPYEVEYALRTRDYLAVEIAAHKILDSFRLKGTGGGVEWFTCSISEAKAAVRKAAQQSNSQFADSLILRHLKPETAARLHRLLGAATVLALAGFAGSFLLPSMLEHLGQPLAEEGAVSQTLPALRIACGAWLGAQVALAGLRVHLKHRKRAPFEVKKTRARAGHAAAKTSRIGRPPRAKAG